MRSRRNTSGELSFSFPWCTAAVLERGAWGWRQSPSFESWLCHSEHQRLHSENEDGNTTRLQWCFLFSFYHLFHFFFKIRSWPTKLISWPNHWSWKPWHSSYLIIFFFLGNTRIWTWNVSVQHLCITRITSLYSFEIKEKNTSFMDTESEMLWAGRLRSCVALSEFPNLSVSLFPVF